MLASPRHEAKWRAVLPLVSARVTSTPFLTKSKTTDRTKTILQPLSLLESDEARYYIIVFNLKTASIFIHVTYTV